MLPERNWRGYPPRLGSQHGMGVFLFWPLNLHYPLPLFTLSIRPRSLSHRARAFMSATGRRFEWRKHPESPASYDVSGIFASSSTALQKEYSWLHVPWSSCAPSPAPALAYSRLPSSGVLGSQPTSGRRMLTFNTHSMTTTSLWRHCFPSVWTGGLTHTAMGCDGVYTSDRLDSAQVPTDRVHGRYGIVLRVSIPVSSPRFPFPTWWTTCPSDGLSSCLSCCRLLRSVSYA